MRRRWLTGLLLLGGFAVPCLAGGDHGPRLDAIVAAYHDAGQFQGAVLVALDDEIIYRHRWRLGDMLICDNRACLHRAQRDYDPEEDRVVHRIILAGDRPV